MSLFVCDYCRAIENTACYDRNFDTNPLYPNMHMIEMQGCGEEVTTKDFHKEANEVVMLCSACNTGVFHNEFEKSYATEDELVLAKLSKYSMITPYDHPEGTIFKNNAAPHGYSSYPSEEKGITITSATGKRTRNSTLLMMAGMAAACGIDISTVMTGGLGQKVNSKDEQPESEKERMLKLAELKRKIKVLKKHKDLSIVQEELQNLQTMYNALKGGYHPC